MRVWVWRYWLLLCCCLPALGGAQEVQEEAEVVAPSPRTGVTLSLEFYYGEVKAADVTEVLTFSEDGSAYELSSDAIAVGLARLLYGDSSSHSSGVVDATHGLLMTRYQQTRGSRAPQQAVLEGGTLHLQRGEETREEAVTPPLFDHLSAVYRSYLLGRAAAGRIQYTNGWRLTEYEYVHGGSEVVETGMGEMEAVLLTRESARGVRKIWLAPQLDYLPVRLYVDDKGHEFTTIVQQVLR